MFSILSKLEKIEDLVSQRYRGGCHPGSSLKNDGRCYTDAEHEVAKILAATDDQYLVQWSDGSSNWELKFEGERAVDEFNAKVDRLNSLAVPVLERQLELAASYYLPLPVWELAEDGDDFRPFTHTVNVMRGSRRKHIEVLDDPGCKRIWCKAEDRSAWIGPPYIISLAMLVVREEASSVYDPILGHLKRKQIMVAACAAAQDDVGVAT